MNIAKLDSNFSSNDRLPSDVVFYDSRTEPFRGYGLYHFQEGPVFRRMPQEAADLVSSGVSRLCRHTAGGRVRFRTDSDYIVIRALLADGAWMGHMPFLGSCGFSVYVKTDGPSAHYKSVIPAAVCDPGDRNRLEGTIGFSRRETREITVYFPLYCGVEDLWIGLGQNASLEPGSGYRNEKPVLYYGSSITQGGCASRPGNSYEGFISRALDCDYINLGFSGNGKAEIPMAEYLASLDVSAFVMDYDHNAPDAEYLSRTHERLYRIYRERQPDVPVLMISKPDFKPYDDSAARRRIIESTFENALRQGDRHVYFIDGETLFQGFGPSGADCTVDGCHPNDLGFYRMAEKIGDALRRICGLS